MRMQRLMENAGMKLADSPTMSEEQKMAVRTFKRLDDLIDETEITAKLIESGNLGDDLRELGYNKEKRAIASRLNKVHQELMDIVIGLEQRAKGD